MTERHDQLRTTLPTFTVAFRERGQTIVEILPTLGHAAARQDELTAAGVDSVVGYHAIRLRTRADVRYGRTARKITPRSPMQPFAVPAINNDTNNDTNRSLLDRKPAGQAQFSLGIPVSKVPAPVASSGLNAAQPNLLHSAHAGCQLDVSYSRCGAVTTGIT